MSLSRGLGKLSGLHPGVAQHARWTIAVAEFFGIHPTVTSGFRSIQKQRELWEAYQAGKSRWPAAPPGRSAHNFGLAWDSWVPDDQLDDWIRIREWAGWKVLRGDEIHAEVPGWRQYVIMPPR